MYAEVATTSPTVIVSAVFERLNLHDVHGLMSLVAEDVSEDWPVVGHLDGRSAVTNYFEMLFAALPDLHVETERLAANGETVFVHWHANGTFSGAPFKGIRATGRAIDLRGTDCFTVLDGKIVANFIAYDGMAFAVQAGILPQPGTPLDRMMTAGINFVTRVRGMLGTDSGHQVAIPQVRGL
jgi:predicted ester cyclase